MTHSAPKSVQESKLKLLCMSVCVHVYVCVFKEVGESLVAGERMNKVNTADSFKMQHNKSFPVHATSQTKRLFLQQHSQTPAENFLFSVSTLQQVSKKKFPPTHRCRFVPAGSPHWKTKRAREALQREDVAAHEQRSPHPHRRL